MVDWDDISRALAEVSNYAVRCARCRYSRQYGNARLTAEVKASVHRIRTGHPVNLLLNGEVIERKDEIPGQQSLDDVPPF